MTSVVIPVRNEAATLAEQLEALAAQECSDAWEVVIADNGSTDGTGDIVKQFSGHFANLIYITAAHGIGINYCRNAGVRASRGSRILLCDGDDRVYPGWIEALRTALDKYDVVSGPLDNESLNSEQVALLSEGVNDARCPVAGGFLAYGWGCNLAFKREVWSSVGGFDADWRRGSTEIEFCWRAQLAGFTLGWAPEAVVAYRRGGSVSDELRKRLRSAMSQARLYRAFRHSGMPRSSVSSALKAWLWLVYRSPGTISSAVFRRKWLLVVVWRAGLVVGSLRYRVVYL